MRTQGSDEEELAGGNTSGRVVRIGGTVRKPWLPTTERTVAFMRSLRDRGVDVPGPRGRDEQGRLAVEYVPGDLALTRAPLDDGVVRRVGDLVRTIHDASAGLPVPDDWEVLLPAEQPDLLCHNDLATWNLVIDGNRLVFIDWDGAGPSTREWDLAYAAISFGHLFAGEDPHRAARRLAAFVHGYRPDPELCAALPRVLVDRARAMHDLLRDSHRSGRQPWAGMYADGHGDLWAGAAAFITGHQQLWSEALGQSP